jgi:hypothetical protein
VLEPNAFDLRHILDASAWTIVRRRRKAKACRRSISSTASKGRPTTDRGSHNFWNSIFFVIMQSTGTRPLNCLLGRYLGKIFLLATRAYLTWTIPATRALRSPLADTLDRRLTRRE